MVAVAVVLVAYLGLSAFRFVLRPRVFQWPEPGTFRLSAFAVGLFVVYLTAGWSITGRTIGKQVMGLRAVRNDGGRIGAGRALIRAILCTFFPVGLVWCADRSQASGGPRSPRGDRGAVRLAPSTPLIRGSPGRSLITLAVGSAWCGAAR